MKFDIAILFNLIPGSTQKDYSSDPGIRQIANKIIKTESITVRILSAEVSACLDNMCLNLSKFTRQRPVNQPKAVVAIFVACCRPNSCNGCSSGSGGCF